MTFIQIYNEHMSKFLFKSLNKMREQCRCHNRFKGEVKEQLQSQLGNVEMHLPMAPSLLPEDVLPRSAPRGVISSQIGLVLCFRSLDPTPHSNDDRIKKTCSAVPTAHM